MTISRKINSLSIILMLTFLPAVPAIALANDILGELQMSAAGDVEKFAGVWVDGQYLGYLKELKGSRKVLLLPGRHQVVVRYAGYLDFSTDVVVEPGAKRVIAVRLERDPNAVYPDVTAELKLSVNPSRAAVFLDGRFVGHVDEFDGPGQALLVAPGKRQLKITLPGYRPLDTELELRANQKFELKTELLRGSILQAGPLLSERKP